MTKIIKCFKHIIQSIVGVYHLMDWCYHLSVIFLAPFVIVIAHIMSVVFWVAIKLIQLFLLVVIPFILMIIAFKSIIAFFVVFLILIPLYVIILGAINVLCWGHAAKIEMKTFKQVKAEESLYMKGALRKVVW